MALSLVSNGKVIVETSSDHKSMIETSADDKNLIERSADDHSRKEISHECCCPHQHEHQINIQLEQKGTSHSLTYKCSHMFYKRYNQDY